MNTTQNELTQAASDLREQFQEWLDSYEPDRLKEIDIRPVASLLDVLSTCGDVLPADYCDLLEIPKGSTYAKAVTFVRMQACFPGWRPEHGTTSYGYPVLPDMGRLTDSEVREWAKQSLKTKSQADVEAEGPTDLNWVIDGLRWSGEVMEAVVGRLGDADAELQAYATDVFTRADAEIVMMREESQPS